MKLFLLELNKDLQDWDCNLGFVIRAADEEEARKMISEDIEKTSGDEGKDAWLDPKSSSCQEILRNGEKAIILNSFRSG